MGPHAHHRLQAVNTRGEAAETMKDETGTAEMMAVVQEDAVVLAVSMQVQCFHSHSSRILILLFNSDAMSVTTHHEEETAL